MGAIDPVGMTNASASNVRNKKASTNAIATDSIVSRTVRPAACGGAVALAAVTAAGAGFDRSGFFSLLAMVRVERYLR